MDTAKLAAARLWAANQCPYFATGLFALTPVAAPGLGTFAVDRRWRVYCDPARVDEWTVSEIGTVLLHELLHVVREHAERGDAMGIGPDDAVPWNVACDAEINDDLVALGMRFPIAPILPRTIGCANDGLAETYYASLPRVLAVECGSGAHGQVRVWEAAEGGIDKADVVLLRRQVAHAVAEARRAGTVPKGFARWADDSLEPTIDWRRALAAEVRRAVHLVTGRVDVSYRRPSRRSSALPDVVLPSPVRPVPAVAVVVDTSASMADDELVACLAEVDGIISGVGLRTVGVPVLACDAAVHAVTRVVSSSRVVLGGGGGTDMGAGLLATTNLRPRPEVVVVLTDGHTPWPDAPPAGTRVVVGLVGPRVGGAPAWARTVRIPCT